MVGLVVDLARKVIISVPDDVPIEWLLGQIDTLILRWRIARKALREIVDKSKLMEEDAEEIGENVKTSAWKKLRETFDIRD